MDIKSFITLAPGVEIETLVEEPVGRTGINVINFFSSLLVFLENKLEWLSLASLYSLV